MLQVNPDWVYRKIHIFHVLINMKTNNILSISPALEPLFTTDLNMDVVISNIKGSLSLNNQQAFIKTIEKLVSLGVLFDA